MTRQSFEKIICAICGYQDIFVVIDSTSACGTPDLDLRSPYPARAVIYNSIQRCANCGYCALNIAFASNDSELVIQSKEYQSILKDREFPRVAASYLALSYENELRREYEKAAWNVINAAWICDDEKRRDSAIKCRKKAVELIQKLDDEKSREMNLDVVSIDLMRRAEMFQEACEQIRKLEDKALNDMLQQVIQFENKLIEKKDTAVYSVSDT